MESRILKVDFKGFDALKKGLDGKFVVKVGIFSNKTNRESQENQPLSNADLGAIHEFGSFTKKDRPPARSFLRMPIAMKAKQIMTEAKKGAEALLAKGQSLMVFRRLGIACENAVTMAFESGGFGQWKKTKTGHAILIDTGQLKRSIASKAEKT